MFEKFYSAGAVAAVLVPQAQYHPFPRGGEENTLSEAQKVKMIANGEKYLGYDWPTPKAMEYIRFTTAGSRMEYEHGNYRLRRTALSCLMDAEYAEARGRFIPDIINGMWAIMDEGSWVVPAHNAVFFMPHNVELIGGEDRHSIELPDFDKPPIIDLFGAGTAGMLSHAYYFFREEIDAVSPLVLRRLEKVLEERIFAPFMKYNYWWTGLGHYDPPNNWNPWILSNVLSCYAYVCKDEEKRAAAVARACRMLEKFVGGYNDDGGCDEGPSYWGVAGASFFDCLGELSDMMGNAFDDVLQHPKVQNIGRYIYRAHIAGEYFTNYADAPKLMRVSCDLVYRFGKKIGDENMVRLAVALHNLYKGSEQEMLDSHRYYRHMQEILNAGELEAAEDRGFPLVQDVYLDGLEQMMAREKDGSTDGLYLAAKGGHNGEGHSHNDIGSFVLYSDGQPVVIDLGSGVYNAKTFSPQRFEIPQMQSAYHNLPIINGAQQLPGRDRAAADAVYSCENGVSTLSMNILPVYDAAARAEKWQRTFVFDRNEKTVTITDEAVFTGEENSAETVFMLSAEPVREGNTLTVTVPGARPVVLAGEGVRFVVEEFDLSYDPNLTRFWNGKVWRVKAMAACGKEHKQVFTLAQA